MFVLETDRLILRHHKLPDYEDWEARENPARFLARAGSLEQARLMRREWFVNQWAKQEERADSIDFWAVVFKAGPCYIGQCGGSVERIEDIEVTELGWYLCPNYWGLGLATEAARGVVSLLQGHRELPPLVATILPENIASCRVAEKIGMAYKRDISRNGETLRLYSL